MISPIAPQDIKCISPIVMAPKKDGLRTSHEDLMAMIADALEGRDIQRPLTEDTGLLRLCQNFFNLNQATEIPPFLPGDLNTKVANHSKKKYRMKLDATSGFFNVKLDEESRAYTAMFVEGMGFFAWNVMPMGLTGAPTTYQLGMHEALDGLIGAGTNMDIWMDDIYGSADTFDELLDTLDNLLTRVEDWGIKLAPKKSELFFDHMTIGGQIVSEEGVSPDPAKVLAIIEFPKPTTVKDVMSFVGAASFHRRFIKGFASIIAPLTDLTKGVDSKKSDPKFKKLLETTKVKWEDRHHEAFMTIKDLLSKFPVVNPPIYDKDPPTPFHIATDASAIGYGAHLYQIVDDTKYTIAYASKKNTESESKRASYEQEFMAVRYALEEFKTYIHGQRTVVHTDCKAVRDTMNKENSLPVYERAKLAILSSGIIQFVHEPGRENVVADALSRYPAGEPTADPEEDPSLKGLTNDLFFLDLDEGRKKLQDEFAGDQLEDVVKFLTELTGETEDRVRKRAQHYWYKDGCLWTYSAAAGYAIRVRPDHGGLERAILAHNTIGHQGVNHTMRAIKTIETWANLRVDVQEAVKSCQNCCRFTGDKLKTSKIRPVARYVPFNTVAMDYLKMPEDDTHEWILVAVDLYSRFTFAWPISGEPTAQITINGLAELERQYLTPTEVLTDGGSHFNNAAVRQWLSGRGSWLTVAAAYQHVGSVESANKLILDRIRKLTGQSIDFIVNPDIYHNEWMKLLPTAVAHVNDRRISWLADYSPRQILFGRADRCPSQLYHQAFLDQETVDAEVQKAYDEEQQRRKDRDKTRINREWKAGDLVLWRDGTTDNTHNVANKSSRNGTAPSSSVRCSTVP